MTALRRRCLLCTSLAAAGIMPTAGADNLTNGLPPASDVAVIRLCGELIELAAIEVEIYDSPNRVTNDEEAARAAAPGQARIHEIIMQLGAVRAATAAGVLARVRALAAYNGDFGSSFDDPEDDGAGRMLALLVRDAAAIGAPLPRPVVDPDQLRGEA